MSDSDVDDAEIVSQSNKRHRSLADAKQAAKRRRSAAVGALAQIPAAPARPVQKENSVVLPPPKEEAILSINQRMSMAETALAAFAMVKIPLPLDRELTSSEGVSLDPIPIVDWLAVLFLAHHKAAKVHLHDVESIAEAVDVTPRYI